MKSLQCFQEGGVPGLIQAFVLDGNSELVAHVSKIENILKFANDIDLNKCLKHIKLPSLLLPRATISELPSNISTMEMVLPWS